MMSNHSHLLIQIQLDFISLTIRLRHHTRMISPPNKTLPYYCVRILKWGRINVPIEWGNTLDSQRTRQLWAHSSQAVKRAFLRSIVVLSKHRKLWVISNGRGGHDTRGDVAGYSVRGRDVGGETCKMNAYNHIVGLPQLIFPMCTFRPRSSTTSHY
ncbi:uncharacterized protein CC84DRAFT_1161696 [Paraphaeosphaeria sporulosa]|uniref:Uncharacterized protein n=1 Tax=Paraphaeosphaeria sporulosa TaxID=1460663 RepID=A0A177CVH1_9PLEO|nr:uncharacterized protein CC84DRAFT_1161696 [Paraphaeosphaeria sporulosa]OAG10860.1 hypothetical protein CC84DRAFT_1161696 [Paraphaeosphaeria sporulosa]